jgi:hypothetical protein
MVLGEVVADAEEEGLLGGEGDFPLREVAGSVK